MKVLIVEDEVLIRMILSDSLKDYGCEIVGETNSGEESIRLAVLKKPDLVLMDIKLKGDMDGLKAASEINKIKKIPIAIISAYSKGDIDKYYKIDNFLGFYGKPLSEKSLIAIINKAKELNKLK